MTKRNRRGSGHITERSPGRWEVRVSLGTDPHSGRRRVKTRTVTGTRRQAQAALTALLGEVEAGLRAGSDATVGVLLDRWMEGAAPDWSPRTAHNYAGYIARRIRPRWGAVRLRDVRASDLDAWYDSLRAEGLAPATVRMIHAILHRALEQAVAWEWLPSNPASRTRRKKAPRHEVTPPSPEVVVRLLRAADVKDAEMGTYVRLAAATGARRGELTALRWQDIHPERRELRIAGAVVAVPGSPPVLKSTKTENRRWIALDDATLVALAAHRERAEERYATVAPGRPLPATAYLFSPQADYAVPWHPDHFTGAWGKLRTAAGAEGVRLHDVRHYAASEMIGRGVDIVAVSKRLGHSSPVVTLSIYSHALRANDHDAAAIMGGLLDPPEEIPS